MAETGREGMNHASKKQEPARLLEKAPGARSARQRQTQTYRERDRDKTETDRETERPYNLQL